MIIRTITQFERPDATLEEEHMEEAALIWILTRQKSKSPMTMDDEIKAAEDMSVSMRALGYYLYGHMADTSVAALIQGLDDARRDYHHYRGRYVKNRAAFKEYLTMNHEVKK